MTTEITTTSNGYYSLDKRCKKCGFDNVHMEFLEIGKKVYSQDKDFKVLKKYIEIYRPESPYTNASYKISKECIKYHCKTCHYEWATPTLDEADSEDRVFTSFPIEEPTQPYQDPFPYHKEHWQDVIYDNSGFCGSRFSWTKGDPYTDGRGL